MAQIINRGKNTWLIRILTNKGRGGKREYFNKTIHGSKQEAIKFAAQKTAEFSQGLINCRFTFKELWDRYLTATKQQHSPNTIRGKKQYYSKHFKHWENIYINEINTINIQTWVNKLSEKYCPLTVRCVYASLAAFFEACRKWKTIPVNPCKDIILPKYTKKLQIEPLSDKEIHNFLLCCQNSKFGLFFKIQIITGLRTGELRALCWDCVNFEEGFIQIKRRVDYQTGSAALGTKTPLSLRKIRIDNNTLQELYFHKMINSSELVFPGSIPGKVINHSMLTREFKRLLNEAGIEKKGFRMYDLRHSCASYLLRKGVPVRAVADLLGHSSPKMTLDTYNHSVFGLDLIIQEKFAEVQGEEE